MSENKQLADWLIDFFKGLPSFKFNNFRLVLGMVLTFHSKKVKTKSQKSFEG